MENKRIGVLLVIIALVVGGIFLYYNTQLLRQAEEMGCFTNDECVNIEGGITLTHVAIGIFSFILSLGFYLLFFNKTDEKIMRKLEDDRDTKIKDEKFKYILMGLDSFEQNVMKAIRDQDGITQSTLRLRVNISKAKLSYVLKIQLIL